MGSSWGSSSLRPCPPPDIVKRWSCLLNEWIAHEEIPLLVRKVSGQENMRGSKVLHESGRILVPCDNSPAQWVYATALRGKCPSLIDIPEHLDDGTIPLAMIQKSIEKNNAHYPGVLKNESNLNKPGWKLAHIENVGLRSRMQSSKLPIEKLVEHFRLFMSPANMFLIPLKWAGMAEVESFVESMRKNIS